VASLFGKLVSFVPTEPDVKRLMEAFPDIQPDVLIPYADVERVANIKLGTSRWRSVTVAWRRRLYREQNFRLDAVAGEGFKRLMEQDRSHRDTKEWLDKQRGAIRRVEDMRRVVTQNFDPEALRQHTHRTDVLVKTTEAIRTTAREIVPPKPQKALPKMMTPK